MNRSFFDNFIAGVGSVIDLYGVTIDIPRIKIPEYSPVKPGGPEDDAKALFGDWQKVGDDLRRAMRSIDETAHVG